jgi:hypothetical protein
MSSFSRFREGLVVENTSDSTSLDTGAVKIGGGIAAISSISLGGKLQLFNNGKFTALQSSSSSNGSIFTLPSNPPSSNGYSLISDTLGNLSFSLGLTNNTLTFSGSNNQTSFANITGLSYSSGSFETDVTISIIATVNLTQLFKLSGTVTGSGNYVINVIRVTGDNSLVDFSITNSGQIQYISGNYTGFVSLTFTWNSTNSSAIISNLTSGISSTGSTNLGEFFTVQGASFTDNVTINSGTLSNFNSTFIGQPTINAVNTSVITTTANSLYIQGPPIAGSNETITNSYSLNIGSGNSIMNGNLNVSGNVVVTGNLSKGSGTFDIIHPLIPSKRLIHSFIEGPRCDNLYRGTVKLTKGYANVNLDKDIVNSPECAMTEGTFNQLNTNVICFLQNNDSFDRVIYKLNENHLEIFSENINSVDYINWMVIGERRDKCVIDWNRTNENGNLITEYNV